ncbi:NAD(P)/FAD-dependent oxidoreductase [Methanorbis rubei]|uniref:NAD(P)/FAD-dependent oxidoreductase n=1 Tax=Methanorbis rubei TaxID=3028300 RepID=UPI0030B91ADA
MIISGAGAAGCVAAKLLADAGYSVLVAEKMSLLREKSCNGILIRKSIAITEHVFGQIPQAVRCNPQINKGFTLLNEQRVKSTVEGHGMNVWRNLFNYWMAVETEDAGARVLEKTEVIDFRIEEDHVAVSLLGKKTRTEKGRVLLGCDGVTGAVRKTLRNRPGDSIATYQTFSPGSVDLDPDYFHAYLQPEYSGHAAWCCIKDEFVVITVSGRDPSMLPEYYQKFTEYLVKEFDAELGDVQWEEYGLLPDVAPTNPVDIGEGRIFFAGDAANFLTPVCEGISPAFMSAYAFAEAYKRICKPGEDPNPEKLRDEYERNLASSREHMYQQWKMLGYASPRFAYLTNV